MTTLTSKHSPLKYYNSLEITVEILYDKLGLSLYKCKQIVQAVNAHEALVESQKEMIKELKKYHDECGDCDHAVGVCVCHLIRMIEDAEAVLKLAGRLNRD